MGKQHPDRSHLEGCPDSQVFNDSGRPHVRRTSSTPEFLPSQAPPPPPPVPPRNPARNAFHQPPEFHYQTDSPSPTRPSRGKESFEEMFSSLVEGADSHDYTPPHHSRNESISGSDNVYIGHGYPPTAARRSRVVSEQLRTEASSPSHREQHHLKSIMKPARSPQPTFIPESRSRASSMRSRSGRKKACGSRLQGNSLVPTGPPLYLPSPSAHSSLSSTADLTRPEDYGSRSRYN